MFRRDRQSYARAAILPLLLIVAAYSSAQQPTDSSIPTEAPATPWALPMKGGAIRVSAVVPADATDDLDALAARFELKLTPHAFADKDIAAFDQAMADALSEKCEVLVVSSGALEALSPATHDALKARQNGGMGLLWFSYASNGVPTLQTYLGEIGLKTLDPAPDFVGAIGGTALTGFKPGFDAIDVYAEGKSRAAEVRFWEARPRGHATVPLAPLDALDSPETFENYLALAGRVLRWAADRDPEVGLARLEERAAKGPQEEETPPELPGRFVEKMQQAALPGVLRTFAVSLDRPAPRGYTLRVQARYPRRGIRGSFDAAENFRKGSREAVITVPLGAGDCFLDVWLMDGLRVVDWFTQPLSLAATPEITELNLGPVVLESNDRLRVTGEVEGRMQASQTGTSAQQIPVAIFVRITDASGREEVQRDILLPPAGGHFAEEIPLVDLLGSYARAEVFVTTAAETPLTWWTRARADYRAEDLVVRRAFPTGLALIAEEPGEGSFAGSTRRRKLVAQGIDFIFPGDTPAVGNIAADGAVPIVNLGELSAFPGEAFDARAKSGVALRQAAAPYASLRPGLYVLTATSAEAGKAPEARRQAIQKVVRETDPRALLALLDQDYSAADTAGFVVVPLDAAVLKALPARAAGYTALRAALPQGDGALERAHWLPWLAAVHQINALWISDPDEAPESFVGLMEEVHRVREGFDVLLQQGTPTPISGDASLRLDPDFAGVARRYEFSKATVYAFLADPARKGKSGVRLKTEGDARVCELTAPAVEVRPSRNLSLKLRAGEAAIAAVLPYEVSRVAIEMPESTPAGRRITLRASVKTRSALPGDHILRINCFDPHSRRLDQYCQTIVAPGGAGAARIPTAYSDMPGAYRVVVHDVLSGVEAEATFNVVMAKKDEKASSR